uniref:Cytochrome P450 n=1 Tax=Candidatus Kentrum sp. FM TaxID=2126340 RepID=A0A450WXL5_9GAMM|nr:MAG: hypothetical protein BECKFM1743C_GA0114222_108081 [Candidatus Kentron sp. FM]VFJ75680.1 MAG: hypothetical protein BECKFM1743A_GA0114220_108601 [Candidatus Kentron sp. FM]VFK21802.1 MAG: hypothetical protein BECKFM1743B_GA0114221_108171 [Candidatus Kentron sp. FM]
MGLRILDIDFDSQTHQEKLYDLYTKLHSSSPIFMDRKGDIYLSKYADCRRLLREKIFVHRLEKDAPLYPPGEAGSAAMEEMIRPWMICADPPEHARLRSVLGDTLAPRSINMLLSDIRVIALGYIERLPVGQVFDFIEQFARPFPITVMSQVLGIPLDHPDLEKIPRWTHSISMAFDRQSTTEDIELAEPAVHAFRRFVDELLALPEIRAGDGALGAMLNLYKTGKFSYEEIAYGLMLVIGASHGNIRSMLSSGLLLLLTNPSQLDRFCSRVDLSGALVEEILRVESPVQRFGRWASEDCRFGDTFIERGRFITALIGAANRDPAVFEAPNAFRIEREPNEHLSFGKGIHLCSGFHLARVEGRIAFERLHPLLPRMELLDFEWNGWSEDRSFRSLKRLNVKINE